MKMVGAGIIGILMSIFGFSVFHSETGFSFKNLMVMVCVIILWNITLDYRKN